MLTDASQTLTYITTKLVSIIFKQQRYPRLATINLLFIAAMVLSSCNDQSTKNNRLNTNELKVKLITLEKQSWEAWKNHDGKFYENFLSDDHIEVGPSGISTKTEVVQLVSSGRCAVITYSTDSFSFKMLDDKTAMLNYHAAQQTACGKFIVPSPAWITSVYCRRGDKWLNVVYQQSWPAGNSK